MKRESYEKACWLNWLSAALGNGRAAARNIRRLKKPAFLSACLEYSGKCLKEPKKSKNKLRTNADTDMWREYRLISYKGNKKDLQFPWKVC